jgi:hypothetical protein
MVLFTTFMQTKFRPCKLNLDRTVYTVFRNIRYSSKSSNVLNTVFSKQNISCFEIRQPRPIWSVNVFLCIVLQQLTYIYRAQRKHVNYSIWQMRISRHDLRRRYSNSLVIDAGSQFSLRACSQAKFHSLQHVNSCHFVPVNVTITTVIHGGHRYIAYCIYQKIHACRNPRLADKTTVFSEHVVSKVVVMVTR